MSASQISISFISKFLQLLAVAMKNKIRLPCNFFQKMLNQKLQNIESMRNETERLHRKAKSVNNFYNLSPFLTFSSDYRKNN